jgi:hypothetical protein
MIGAFIARILAVDTQRRYMHITIFLIVILNLFQDDKQRWCGVLKQVQDDAQWGHKKAAPFSNKAAFCMQQSNALCFVACLS